MEKQTEATINKCDAEGNVKTGYEQTMEGESLDSLEWEYRCHAEWAGPVLISTEEGSVIRTGEGCPTDWEA